MLEALLTDAEPRLPEVVRLAWLLSQLNLDLAPYADLLPRARLHRAAPLALIPLVLDAAELADLTTLNRQTLQLALESWDIEEKGRVELAEILDTWYGVFRDSRPPLGAGFKALDEMLGA